MSEAIKEYYQNRISSLEDQLDKLGKELVFTVIGLEGKIISLEQTIKQQQLKISDLEMGIDNFRGKAMLDR